MTEKGSEARQDVIVRRARIQLDIPASIYARDRRNIDRLINVVVEEALKHGREGAP